MAEPAIDPLLLGQRVVAILETGLRTATYKLATLMALIDQCIEHLPDSPDDVLAVPVGDLAHRVLELYWPQVRPFHGQLLQQIHGSPNAAIPARHAPCGRRQTSVRPTCRSGRLNCAPRRPMKPRSMR